MDPGNSRGFFIYFNENPQFSCSRAGSVPAPLASVYIYIYIHKIHFRHHLTEIHLSAHQEDVTSCRSAAFLICPNLGFPKTEHREQTLSWNPTGTNHEGNKPYPKLKIVEYQESLFWQVNIHISLFPYFLFHTSHVAQLLLLFLSSGSCTELLCLFRLLFIFIVQKQWTFIICLPGLLPGT